MVKMLANKAEFDKAISSSKLVVIDFYATWCGPCKMIAPFVEQLSQTEQSVEFYKVDVDEAEDIASHCGIEAMPTFQFYKNGKKLEEMRGANKDGLAALVAKHK